MCWEDDPKNDSMWHLLIDTVVLANVAHLKLSGCVENIYRGRKKTNEENETRERVV